MKITESERGTFLEIAGDYEYAVYGRSWFRGCSAGCLLPLFIAGLLALTEGYDVSSTYLWIWIPLTVLAIAMGRALSAPDDECARLRVDRSEGKLTWAWWLRGARMRVHSIPIADLRALRIEALDFDGHRRSVSVRVFVDALPPELPSRNPLRRVLTALSSPFRGSEIEDPSEERVGWEDETDVEREGGASFDLDLELDWAEDAEIVALARSLGEILTFSRIRSEESEEDLILWLEPAGGRNPSSELETLSATSESTTTPPSDPRPIRWKKLPGARATDSMIQFRQANGCLLGLFAILLLGGPSLVLKLESLSSVSPGLEFGLSLALALLLGVIVAIADDPIRVKIDFERRRVHVRGIRSRREFPFSEVERIVCVEGPARGVVLDAARGSLRVPIDPDDLTDRVAADLAAELGQRMDVRMTTFRPPPEGD